MMAGFILVVAGVLIDQDGRWLMHRRPLDKHHGGRWEFPGGKVESGETPANALVRELREELGIEVAPDCWEPVGFAEDRPEVDAMPIVILLYKVSQWDGDPKAIEGEAVGWFAPDEVARLDKPPLDQALARSLADRS